MKPSFHLSDASNRGKRLSPVPRANPLLSLACVLTSILLSGCSDPITVENFNRIQVGMSVEEVSKIMDGRKPESYQTFKTWRGPSSHTISVEIDDRGLVVNKTKDGF
jgi:hypothetical protein